MHKSVNIMNVEIDILSTDIFTDIMNDYLESDKLNTIFFASADTMNLLVEDEDFRQIVEQADLFLPGEEILLSNHQVDLLEAGDMVVSCKSLGRVLKNLKKAGRSLYVLAKDSDEKALLENWCKKMQPELNILEGYVYDPDMEDAALVNNINIDAPDMLLISLNTGFQEEWILNHIPMLNTNICIAVGGVVDLILAEEKEVPSWVKKLHLSGLYEKLVLEQKVKKSMKEKNFKKQVDEFDSKI